MAVQQYHSRDSQYIILTHNYNTWRLYFHIQYVKYIDLHICSKDSVCDDVCPCSEQAQS